MRMLTFAKRNIKEILRDPINLGFGLGFPLVLLGMAHGHGFSASGGELGAGRIALVQRGGFLL